MPETDDNERYIEYLQNELLTPGWDVLFDSKVWAEWYDRSKSRLRELVVTSSDGGENLLAHIERLAREFKPDTRFELPETTAIFEPLLEQVTRAAQARGLKPVREVRVATSTDISATPLARPSSGTHLLFIGPGTSAFCNYWAKAFTAVVKTITLARPQERIESVEDLRARLKTDPSGVALAGRLALYYAVFGTVLGFGEVKQPREYLVYRLALLAAIETFAVAHEYAHYVAEERLPELQGQKLELFCDDLGLQISRNCSYSGDGWLGFTGVGALVLFRSFQLCELVRDLLHESASELANKIGTNERPSSHPMIEERISAIKSNVVRTTAPDQLKDVQQFCEEYDRILIGVTEFVCETVKALKAQSRPLED